MIGFYRCHFTSELKKKTLFVFHVLINGFRSRLLNIFNILVTYTENYTQASSAVFIATKNYEKRSLKVYSVLLITAFS